MCTVGEAKDVYPKLGILANVGLIAAGAFTRYVNTVLAKGNETLSLQVGGGASLMPSMQQSPDLQSTSLCMCREVVSVKLCHCQGNTLC